ncbi:sce7725 family protein [Salinimonas sp. HHU 13199]|uniref:Sce7725 family protein n=1 Tax=Salinimonas profundi TaxID=2729140 RepID=A0ABR8LN42_9ALTE|nr:sce7725 family protein [Salinimonas profundi]MBD3587609.1 sce7725 family protein [Salinimonas profundi]
MYFPVLRGKQFELIALRELAKLGLSNHFVPVIEPVKKISNPFIKTIKELNEGDIHPIVIINSALGEEESAEDVMRLLNNAGVTFLPCISFESHHSAIQFSELQDYLSQTPHVLYIKDISDESIFSKLDKVEIILLEESTSKASQAASFLDIPVVVIEDGFDKKLKNADYPSLTNFSSAIGEYKSLGLHGFGDYTITGSSFAEGGGPAYVVALHLSQVLKSQKKSIFSSKTQIVVNHFCSENNGSYADPAGKFFEALTKLISFLDEGEIFETNSIGEFRKLYNSEHFPGLGAVKKLSVSHHIEIISRSI